MTKFVGKYRVTALNQSSQAVDVEASDSEAARELARPALVRQGVSINDPLLVEQLEGRSSQ